MTRARERLYLLSSSKPSRYLSEIAEKWVDVIGNANQKPQTINPEYLDDLPF
jgi:hypothetical protein